MSNCELNTILTWSSTCFITNSTGAGRFAITDTKRYVPVVTLSTQDNTKLLQQLKSGFKGPINWTKYQSDPKTYAQNRYLYHLIDPSFQEVNRLFVFSFERRSYSNHYLPKVEVKDYDVRIDGKNCLDQPINTDFKTYEKVRKVATGQGNDCITGCLLDYPYFKENYKMILIDLSKQQVLDADPRENQQTNFTRNLDRAEITTRFLIFEKGKETVKRIFTRRCKICKYVIEYNFIEQFNFISIK